MMFPLAFGIVDSESDENWMWFVSELRKMLGVNTDKMPILTILSERKPQVVEAVEVNFPTAFHGFCLRYVSENFREEFKNPKLLNLFWSAVYALTTAEFDSKVNEMMQVQDVMPWLERFPPNLWAVAYFEGIRYGHFSLGITEILYSLSLECHELPIVQTVEHIRHQLTCWFAERRNMAQSYNSVLVPSAEKLVSEAISDSLCYQVLRANKVEFEIVSSERTNIVDTQARCCSCLRWQIYGLPCAHAVAALLSCGEDPRLYAHDCFSVMKYRETYSQPIYPIPGRSHWNNLFSALQGVGSKADVMLSPPKIRRPPGRPKMKILKMESLKRPKRMVQCGRCHLLGHSQKKCSMRS
uniref:SWIM-type domain-containing protein n=1 Tax=Arundo donax TaxID=35708 RepID=A0A0A9D6Y0_ARUDO